MVAGATLRSDPHVIVVGAGEVSLWGLDGCERLRRQARALGLPVVGDAIPGASALLVRADYLFDERTLRDLADRPDTVVLASDARGASVAVAAHVRPDAVAEARAVLDGSLPVGAIAGVTLVSPATLSPAYVGKLLKSTPPLLLPVRADNAAALERHLFDGSYKGVTDLVTKWVWPAPARWATRWCARRGIAPNVVTAMSLVLALAAMALFASGQFGAGLLAAWVMTFLDTVDGKLARVTVTSTQFGHLFDHVIDVVHPPLWYLAWAYGVAGDPAHLSALAPQLIAIFAGYIAGRLVESAFEFGLAGFSIFTWRPLDSYGRLITARRNPNLLLLTAAALANRHELGLTAVACWTVASTLFLAVRLAQAAWVRARGGRLQAWLATVGDEPSILPGYARPFASADRSPAGLVS